MTNITKTVLADLIDYTLLKPDATMNDVSKFCDEALKYKFHAVCINPCYVSTAYEKLKNSEVRTCTVIGFPLGATYPEIKALETQIAIEKGASEIDMVINIGALKSGDKPSVEADIASVVRSAKSAKKDSIVKVIIEAGLLSHEEKVDACKLVARAGGDFVKTSSGFGGSYAKATVEDVRLMRKTLGPNFGVKAAGGIRTLKEAVAMIQAGANRIGTSNGVAILDSLKA